MHKMRRFALFEILGVFALCLPVWAVTLDTEAVTMELPDHWTFTEARGVLKLVSNDVEKGFIRIATTPGQSPRDRKEAFELLQAEIRNFYFVGPAGSENVRIIVPHTTVSLSSTVVYSEMVYEFKNNPGPMAVFTVVRGWDFIVGFTIDRGAIDKLRTMLKSARWK